MSTITPTPDTIRKEVHVRATPETAFRVFTEQMSDWWPLASHSVFGAESTEAILELTPGGRWFERTPDGRESVWGTVVAVEPPTRLLMTFHPGRPPAEHDPMHVEIRFVPEGDRTLVTLEHRGWERCSVEQRAEFDGYDKGWDIVLAPFRDAVAA